MSQLIFSTGNESKFATAVASCSSYGIELIQNTLEIDEIQSEDGELIARDKAEKAYSLLKQPVVVSDDSWAITGLKGFPGAYMKSINHWFQVEDFINITSQLTDRSVYLIAYLAYKDEGQVKVFSQKFEGKLLKKPKGLSGPPSHQVISMSSDNGLSIAEVYDKGLGLDKRGSAEIWKDFAKWYKTNYK